MYIAIIISVLLSPLSTIILSLCPSSDVAIVQGSCSEKEWVIYPADRITDDPLSLIRGVPLNNVCNYSSLHTTLSPIYHYSLSLCPSSDVAIVQGSLSDKEWIIYPAGRITEDPLSLIRGVMYKGINCNNKGACSAWPVKPELVGAGNQDLGLLPATCPQQFLMLG